MKWPGHARTHRHKLTNSIHTIHTHYQLTQVRAAAPCPCSMQVYPFNLTPLIEGAQKHGTDGTAQPAAAAEDEDGGDVPEYDVMTSLWAPSPAWATAGTITSPLSGEQACARAARGLALMLLQLQHGKPRSRQRCGCHCSCLHCCLHCCCCCCCCCCC